MNECIFEGCKEEGITKAYGDRKIEERSPELYEELNGRAMPNGMVIGEDMFKIAQPLADQYTFKLQGNCSGSSQQE